MSTHNIYFCREIRKYLLFWLAKSVLSGAKTIALDKRDI